MSEPMVAPPNLEEENRELRERLRALEARMGSDIAWKRTLQTVLDTIPQRVFWKDREFRYMGCNQLFAGDAGLASPEEVVGKSDFELPWKDLAHLYRSDDEDVLARRVSKVNYEEPLVFPDGRSRWVRTTKVPLLGANGEIIGVLGTFEDITERVRADEALRQSEERYRTLVEQASDGIFIADLKGRYVDVNAAGCAMVGYTRDELVKLTLKDLLPEGRWETDPPRLSELEGGRTLISDRQLRCKDGRIIDVELSAKVIAGGYLQGIVRDITERKRAEADRRRLEAELRESQRLESVGRLAGGVAHDFNNLLSVIVGGCHLVGRALPRSSPARADLDDVLAAADHAAALTRQLLAFSKSQVLELEVLDLNEVLHGAESTLRKLLGADVVFEARLSEGLHPIEADRAQMEQVLMNLAVNARDAMGGKGRITFQTDNVELEPGEVEGAEGAQVRLTVTDTGTGMDEETKLRIFEPFFSTKDPVHGTGLGLATVYGIVTQSGGRIRVHSRTGKGARFELFFPRASREAAVEHVRVAPLVRTTSEAKTVLVVEDEDVLRGMLRRILEPEGLQLIVAADAEDALIASRAHEGPIDVLLTDVVMPGMTGPELAEIVTAERPEIAVILMSGYADGADPAAHRLRGLPFLAKPFTPKELLEVLAEAAVPVEAAGRGEETEG